MKNYLLCLFLLLALALPSWAVTVCGITFADYAFADDIGTYSGSWGATGTALRDLLIGTTVGDSAMSTDTAAYVNILFINNAIKNGTGADLAIFEESGTGSSGAAGCQLSITINGINKAYIPYWVSGTTYVAYIDLTDFSVATNALISTLQIRGAASDPEYTAFGAINTVFIPEPASLILLGIAGLFLTFGRKFVR